MQYRGKRHVREPTRHFWAKLKLCQSSLVAWQWRIHCQCRRGGFDPWVRKIPWRRAWTTHSSILACRIPWTEELVGLQSMGLQRVGHVWRDLAWTLCHRLYMNPRFSVLAVSFCCKDTRNWPFLVAFIHDFPMKQMKVASKYSNFSQVDTKVPFVWSLSRGMAERDAWYWNHQIQPPGVARCFSCVFEACFWSPSKQLLWILSEGHLFCLFC